MRLHFQEAVKIDPTYRLGQAYFNALYEIYPEVADLIVGTLDDPFYNGRSLEDISMTRFFEAIMGYFI